MLFGGGCGAVVHLAHPMGSTFLSLLQGGVAAFRWSVSSSLGGFLSVLDWLGVLFFLCRVFWCWVVLFLVYDSDFVPVLFIS